MRRKRRGWRGGWSKSA